MLSPAEEKTEEGAEETEKTAEAEVEAGDKHLDSLKLQFVPSRPTEEILSRTSPLPELLKEALAGQGYEVDEITVEVAGSFESAGEALSAGSSDLAWLPAGTYVVYSEACDVILTATRSGLSNNSTNPADWNGMENKTVRNGGQVSFYKGLIYAGPSPKGQALSEKVNQGEDLTWEDVKWRHLVYRQLRDFQRRLYLSLQVAHGSL